MNTTRNIIIAIAGLRRAKGAEVTIAAAAGNVEAGMNGMSRKISNLVARLSRRRQEAHCIPLAEFAAALIRKCLTMILLAAGLATIGASLSQAQTTHTVDFDIALSPSQITATTDCANSGLRLTLFRNFLPVSLSPGDTITGTITFNSGDGTALKISDNIIGDFFTIGGSTGVERLEIFLGGTGLPGRVTTQSSSIEFLGVTGDLNVNPVSSGGLSSATGIVASFLPNLVDAGNSSTFTGFNYSLTLLTVEDSGGALALDGFRFQLYAEGIEIVAPPPPPIIGGLYDADFDSDVAGGPPQLHAPGAPQPRLAPTFTAGSPTVQPSLGPLTTQPVVLDSISGPDDTMHFVMNDFPGELLEGVITMEAEIMVQSGASGGVLAMLFMDQAFQKALELQFSASGSVLVLEGAAPKVFESLPLDTKHLVRTEIDLVKDTYSVFIDEVSLFSGAFDTPRDQIIQFTTTVGPALTGLTAGIDNVHISVEPSSPVPEVPEAVAEDFADIGAKFVSCGSTRREPIDGICASPVLVVPGTSVTDCTGFPNPCDAIFDNPDTAQIVTEQPKSIDSVYTGGSNCVHIYTYLGGTLYVFEICSEVF